MWLMLPPKPRRRVHDQPIALFGPSAPRSTPCVSVRWQCVGQDKRGELPTSVQSFPSRDFLPEDAACVHKCRGNQFGCVCASYCLSLRYKVVFPIPNIRAAASLSPPASRNALRIARRSSSSRGSSSRSEEHTSELQSRRDLVC